MNTIFLTVIGILLIGYGYPVESSAEDALLNLFNGNTLQTRSLVILRNYD